MYKVASNRQQTVLHRGRPSDWINGQEAPSATPDEEYRCLVQGAQALEARIKALPHGDDRKALGIQKRELETRIKEIKPLVKRHAAQYRGLAEYFVDIAKEQLPRPQFKAMFEAARRKREQEQPDRVNQQSMSNT